MSRKGFTLIELLIVVAIIGILAAIAVPNFLNARTRALVARVLSEQRSVQEAYTQYFMDRNGWPPHIDSDPAQHRFVTTPVAYLTTSIYDPFGNTFQGREITQWQYFLGQYHVEPAYFWHNRQWPFLERNNPDYWSQQKNTGFFVLSLGPDIDYDQPYETADIYDASNGVQSSGDILRPIRGSFKRQYPYTENWSI